MDVESNTRDIYYVTIDKLLTFLVCSYKGRNRQDSTSYRRQILLFYSITSLTKMEGKNFSIYQDTSPYDSLILLLVFSNAEAFPCTRP